jgi:N,N'-diacetyllegionaminate synthase
MGVLIIAEAGMNHDGSLGNAIRLAETAAECGADAVKFQLHDAEAETTRDAPAPPYFKHETRWEYFERTAFSDEQWHALKNACDAAGIVFLCSAFSVEALRRLEAVGVARHKIPSGEVTNLELVRAAAATGKPVLLSSGMSSWEELDRAVEILRSVPLTVLQCTSEYPCPPEHVGLNVMLEMRERYGLPVGLSDHTLGTAACVAAAAIGAAAVEKHFTLSKEMYGPDASMSLEPDELARLVREVREVERMLAAPVDKDDLAGVADMKRIFEKSVVSTLPIEAGAVISSEMVAVKKPGTGIPAARFAEVVGRRSTRAIAADTVLTDDDVDWNGRPA